LNAKAHLIIVLLTLAFVGELISLAECGEQVLFSGRNLDINWLGTRHSGPYSFSSNEIFLVEWTASRQVSVYILTEADFRKWSGIGAPIQGQFRVSKLAQDGSLQYKTSQAERLYVIVMGLYGNAARLYTWTEKRIWGGDVEKVDKISKNYVWWFKLTQWTYSLEIPSSLYKYYKNLLSQTERVSRGVEGYARLVTTQESFMKKVVDDLYASNQAKSYGYYDSVNYILAFVQSLPYVYDNITTGYNEYPRFPVETLVDGGDCEDKSILLATILKIKGYDAVLISFPNHMGVGVWGHETYSGYYYVYNGRRYYYCETTSSGFVGDLPSKYRNEKATIIPISGTEQFPPSEDIVMAIERVGKKINNTSFLSPNANALLQKAKSEYDLAIAYYYISNDYAEAFQHVQNAADYLSQAELAENRYRQTLAIIGFAVTALTFSTIVIGRHLKKKKMSTKVSHEEKLPN
jgi:hypothetical protein